MRHQNSVFHQITKFIDWQTFDGLVDKHKADFRVAKFTNQVHHFMEVARWERFTTSSIWTSVLNWIACEMQAIHFDELER